MFEPSNSLVVYIMWTSIDVDMFLLSYYKIQRFTISYLDSYQSSSIIIDESSVLLHAMNTNNNTV